MNRGSPNRIKRRIISLYGSFQYKSENGVFELFVMSIMGQKQLILVPVGGVVRIYRRTQLILATVVNNGKAINFGEPYQQG